MGRTRTPRRRHRRGPLRARSRDGAAEGAPELRIASDPNAEGFYVKPVEEGEFIIVPRGLEHRPVADEECHVVLFEPATTLNTGDVQSELTVREPERI